VGGVVVDPEGGDLFAEDVAHDLLQQAQVLPDQARGGHSLGFGLDALPEAAQEDHVAYQVLVPLSDGRGADDEALTGLDVGPDQFAQAVAFLGVGNLAGDADVVDSRHEDQEAARETQVPGQSGPLGADGVLHHLDQGLLALLEGGQGRWRGRQVLAGGLFALLVGGEVGPDALGDGVVQVQEPVLDATDVDEGALHAGQQLGHLAFIDIPHLALVHRPLEEQLAELAVLKQGDARLQGGRIDHQGLADFHGTNLSELCRGSPCPHRGPQGRTRPKGDSFLP